MEALPDGERVMDVAFRDSFSSDCPRCGGGRIHPEAQRNDFAAVAETTPDGEVVTTRALVSVTRRYVCHDCAGVWTETVRVEDADPVV
jgi:hypothetical protein